MKSLSEYIKEKDTDTRFVEEMDDLVYNLIQNDYMYESQYGKSQTKIEAFNKLKYSIYYTLNKILSKNTSAFNCKECNLIGEDDSTFIEVYGFEEKDGQPRSIVRSGNTLNVKGVTSADVTNNSLKIADLPSDVNVSLTGTQCGTAEYTSGGNTIYVPITFRFDGKEVYAIFSDTSFLSDSGVDLLFRINGSVAGRIYS